MQEAPGASNQLLPATALHLQHSKKCCSFRTDVVLPWCISSARQPFPSPIPWGERIRKMMASGCKRRKNGKKGWVIIIATSILSRAVFFSSKEGRVRASCTVPAQFALLQRSHPRCTPSTATNCQLC